jgi:D-alanine transaminase
MPLIEVDGHAVGKGTPGPVTQELIRSYKELVRKELKL